MSSTTKSGRSSLIVNAVLVTLAFGLLGAVVWGNRSKIQEIFSRPLDYRWLALAFAIYLVGLILTFFRWFLLVRAIEPNFKFRTTLILGFIGNVFNLVIPGAVGGDLIKAAYLVRMHIKKTQAVASMVIDRILGLMGLFVLASGAGIFAWSMATPEVAKLIGVAWGLTALSVLALLAIFGQVVSRMFPRTREGHGKLALLMTELNEMSSTYRQRPGLVAGSLALSAFVHTLNVIAFFLIGVLLYPNMKTTLADHFLMVPLTLFTMVVPLPFGALGLSEGIGDRLFALVNHPSGALAMMGFRVVMYGSGLVGACVYLAKLKEARSLTASAHHLEEEMAEGELEEDEPTSDESTNQSSPLLGASD